jgi:hypothetical protein
MSIPEPMSTEFDYEWSPGIPSERIRWAVEMSGDRPFTARWSGSTGAVIQRDVSEAGLERWKIRAWHTRTLDLLERFLRRALAPISLETGDRLKLHPVYPDAGPSFVAWLLWHPKGDTE